MVMFVLGLTFSLNTMVHNVGRIDRIIRVSLSVILVILYFTHIIDSRFDNYLIAGAFLMFVTSLRSCCPIYAILGLGTCKVIPADDEVKIKTKKIDL